MVLYPKSIGPLVLRLIVGLALLGCARMGSAQGTWSVLSLPQQPGEVVSPQALAVDAAGNLYVADYGGSGGSPRIEQRDAQGNWSVIATAGSAPGQVAIPSALAADGAGNLYVVDYGGSGGTARIQKRDAQGNWSVIASAGSAPGQVDQSTQQYAADGSIALAADAAGNLYVGEGFGYAPFPYGTFSYPIYGWRYRIQKRDAQGNWSVIATGGVNRDQLEGGYVYVPLALAVDAAGNLYVAVDEYYEGIYYRGSRIQKRDAQGNWSVLPGALSYVTSLATDAAGNLYVGGSSYGGVWIAGIHKRDAQGNWSLLAGIGVGLGQVGFPTHLAMDSAGNLYVVEGYTRIQKRDTQGNWSVIAIRQGSSWNLTALAADGAGNLYAAVGIVLWKRDVQGNWSVTAAGGTGPGQVSFPTHLAVDSAGNLYVADIVARGVGDPSPPGRLQKRDAQGNWSVIAPYGGGLGQVYGTVGALAVDSAGDLFVGNDGYGGRILQRTAQADWYVIAPQAASALAVDPAGNLYAAAGGGIWLWDTQGNWFLLAIQDAAALAADTAGNLYVADGVGGGRIQRRDAQGRWSVIAANGSALGQVKNPAGLAVDGAGNLYVGDIGNGRVQMYTPAP